MCGESNICLQQFLDDRRMFLFVCTPVGKLRKTGLLVTIKSRGVRRVFFGVGWYLRG